MLIFSGANYLCFLCIFVKISRRQLLPERYIVNNNNTNIYFDINKKNMLVFGQCLPDEATGWISCLFFLLYLAFHVKVCYYIDRDYKRNSI